MRMYPSFFSTALIRVEDKIKVDNDAVMKYMNDKGYPLEGTMKENIDNLIKYGKDINRNSTVQIRDHIIKELREGGYKWID